MLRAVDDQQLGSLLRAVRQKRGWRQQDVATASGIGRSTISQVENGNLDRISIATLRQLAHELEVRVELKGWWRGGDGGRLISRRHSLLAERWARFVRGFPAWYFEAEVSMAAWGERGILDGLGWNAENRHLLVVQLKTEFVDVNETLGTLDRHSRLAREIARQRGWSVAHMSVWLIVADSRTNRRHAAQHEALLETRLRHDGRSLAGFLRNAAEPSTGLAFMPDVAGADTRRENLAPVKAVRPKKRGSGAIRAG